MAVFSGKLAAVRELLASGSYIDIRSKEGVTPISLAISKGRFDIVDLLIKGGAYLNPRAIDGGTPLDLAAYNGDIRIAEVPHLKLHHLLKL